eukprot:3030288-Rhodomonas_salina.3
MAGRAGQRTWTRCRRVCRGSPAGEGLPSPAGRSGCPWLQGGCGTHARRPGPRARTGRLDCAASPT